MATQIWTAQQLDNIRYNMQEADPDDPFAEGPRYIGGDYIQMADIDMNDIGPIYSIGHNPGGDFPLYWHSYQFVGNYNGNGFKIKNLTLVETTASIFTGDNFPIWGGALFARVSGGTIENVIIENCNIRSVVNPWVAYGGIFPIHGYFPIDYACGALVGHLHAGIVRNCSASGIVRTPPQSASTHYMWRAFSYGQLDGGFGGLVGWARGDAGEALIEQCYTNVAIWAVPQHTDLHGPSGVGGLIGKVDLGRPCSSDRTPNDEAFTAHSVTVKNCYSRSNYSGFSHPSIPSDGAWETVHPVNKSIVGASQAGGIGGAIGFVRGGGATIQHIYSTSPTYADDLMHGATGGGLIGRLVDGTVINSYHDKNTSRFSSDDERGMARTSPHMRFPYVGDTYVEWDFNDIWAIDNITNDMYPFFGDAYFNLWVKTRNSPERWKRARTGWVKTPNGWRRIKNLWVKTGNGWKRT